MSIRSGQIIYQANDGFIIDRIQNVTENVQVPTERIYEIGTYTTLALIRDIPDLSFQLDTYDMSTELEQMFFTGTNPGNWDLGGATPVPDWYNFLDGLPIDIISPFRSSFNAFNIIDGIALPQLYLESVAYKFALSQSSSTTWGLRGDSIYYVPGSPYLQQFVATSDQTVFATTSQSGLLPFVEKGIARMAYNVSVNGIRKFLNVDYTESSTSSVITLTFLTGLNSGDVVRVVFGSTTPNTTFPTTETTNVPVTVTPAAVRARDVDVYVEVPGATPDMVRWDGVQAANVNWSVNLQPDAEFGNYHYVSEDYVTAMVKGDVTVKPSSVADLYSKIEQITGTNYAATSGPLTSLPLGFEVQVSIPDTDTVIKTIYCPDARFLPVGLGLRVNTKLTPQFTWESDTGLLYASSGLPPTSNPLGNTV